jgi:hypothetical protein
MTRNKLKEKIHDFLQERVTGQLTLLIQERDELQIKCQNAVLELAQKNMILCKQDELIEKLQMHIQTQARIINYYTPSVLDTYFDSKKVDFECKEIEEKIEENIEEKVDEKIDLEYKESLIELIEPIQVQLDETKQIYKPQCVLF